MNLQTVRYIRTAVRIYHLKVLYTVWRFSLSQGFALLGAVGGLRSGGSALLFVGSSVPGEYNKPIWKNKIKLAVSTRRKTVEQSPGTVFMVCRAQGTMNAQLLVLLYRVCRHKALWTVGRLVAFQNHLNKVVLHIPANWRRCLTLLRAGKGES